MSSFTWTLLVRCSITLLECSTLQSAAATNDASVSWLLMFPVQVLSNLKGVAVKYFMMLKDNLKMDNKQESNPFLPKLKLKATRLLITKTDTDYITSDKLYFKTSLIKWNYLQNITFKCISVSLTLFTVCSS